jgi:hexosaminidase
MKYFSLIFIVFVVACTSNKKPIQVNVIPLPNQLTIQNGSLKTGSELTVSINDQTLKAILNQFQSEIGNAVSLQFTESTSAGLKIELDKEKANDESYTLTTTKKGISISAGSEKGVYYGLQTLRQLILFAEKENNKFILPLLTINDSPRFGWRGLMLDESRHFFGVEKVKQLLDLMALHKLNVFHWHLTDAPGWRIEIKQYPKLTTVGGIGNHSNPDAPAQFYTQNEIKEIVKYAANRFIEVIPEIDMPGHASAANRAYPEFSGGGSKSHPEFTFNPGNEKTYTYLTNILREVTTLFPSEYIHLGGDEVHFGNAAWKTDNYVLALMKKEKLSSLKEVETYFVQRMADSIKMLDRTVIGWDEIVDHKLSNKNSLVMWWRHDKPEKLDDALSNSYNVVLCPRIPLYFDFVQNESHKWGRKWGGKFGTLELTYAFPPDSLAGIKQYKKFVKGMQANIWTERIQNNKRIDFMTHPRLSAMAEAAWTTAGNKNIDDFKSRLKPMLNYFDKQEIYYYNPFYPEQTPEPAGVEKKK